MRRISEASIPVDAVALRTARIAANLTQAELAHLSKVTNTTIWRIEQGKNRTSRHTLDRMARAVQRDAWTLVEEGAAREWFLQLD